MSHGTAGVGAAACDEMRRRGLILRAIGYIMLETLAAGLAPPAALADRLPGMPDVAREWDPWRARELIQVGRALASGDRLRADCALSRLTLKEQRMYDDTAWVVRPAIHQKEQAKAALAVLVVALG